MRLIFIFISFTISINAEDIYIGQTSAGADDGSSCSNCKDITWFNTAGNWGAGAGKISAGDTVHLCGNITTGLTVQGNGATNSPVTILFESGATMIKSNWGPSGAAININARAYITIDGGALGKIGGYDGNEALINGLIQDTDSGSGLSFTNNTAGIWGGDAANIIVKNLAIKDMFKRLSGSGAAGGGSGVYSFWNGGTSPHDWTVTNCVIKDVGVGFFMDYGTTSFNLRFLDSTVYNSNWGGAAGDHDATATMTNIVVRGCYFHDFVNWDSPANTYHHNGFYSWAESGGSLRGVLYENNVISGGYSSGSPNNASSGLFVSGPGATFPIDVRNNIFITTSVNPPADGMIFIWPGATADARVHNNTFLGNGSGIAINLFGGRGTAGQQQFSLVNNACSNMTFVSLFFNNTITLIATNDFGWSLKSGEEYSSSTTGSSVFKTLAQWKALGYDTTSTASSGQINSTNWFPAVGSVLVDTGTDLSAYFALDRIGTVRPNGIGWDIGAMELQHTADFTGQNRFRKSPVNNIIRRH